MEKIEKFSYVVLKSVTSDHEEYTIFPSVLRKTDPVFAETLAKRATNGSREFSEFTDLKKFLSDKVSKGAVVFVFSGGHTVATVSCPDFDVGFTESNVLTLFEARPGDSAPVVAPLATFDDYQKVAMTFASYGGNAMYPVLGISEEAGEVAGKIAKFIRKNDGIDPKKAMTEFPNAMVDAVSQFRHDLEKELGDILWMLAATASEYGLSLGDIAKMNIDKLTDRRNRNVIVGEGDER